MDGSGASVRRPPAAPDDAEAFRVRQLSGWSQRPMATCRVFRPDARRDVSRVLASARPGSLVARGRGTAYGDAAVNDGGAVIEMLRLDRFLAFDAAAGTATCEAGVTLQDLISVSLPRGWFPAVTPGTWRSTVGGCVACDVHGKNHHSEGGFSTCVDSFRILAPDGAILDCARDRQADLFWATLGGMGHTGLLLDVTLRLRRVETAHVAVRYRKLRDLDETFAALERDEEEPYSVAWIDSLARGRRLGRSVLMLGRHARTGDLPPGDRASPLAWRAPRAIPVPFPLPPKVLSPANVRAFNAFYFRRQPDGPSPVILPVQRYFYPLEAIDNFHRLYGRNGLVEYQIAVPSATAFDAIRLVMERLSKKGFGSFLAVVKRLGPGDAAPLSFPLHGYTFAVDVPAEDPALFTELRWLDGEVARRGGRVYLAKDSRLDPDLIDAMYPRRREWAAVVRARDPDGTFESSLGRRLRLRGP